MISADLLLVALGVGLGGALGASARYLLDRFLPGGVLLANVLGSLLIGLLFGALDEVTTADGPPPMHPALLAMLSVGLLGALSTFATVSLRAAQLWMRRRRLRAVGMWCAHAVLGLAAAVLGMWVGHQLMS